jgi:hypothetical protein
MGRLEDKCENLVADGTGHYCKILRLPNGEYPPEYRRVFCYGEKDGDSCKKLREKFELRKED